MQTRKIISIVFKKQSGEGVGWVFFQSKLVLEPVKSMGGPVSKVIVLILYLNYFLIRIFFFLHTFKTVLK